MSTQARIDAMKATAVAREQRDRDEIAARRKQFAAECPADLKWMQDIAAMDPKATFRGWTMDGKPLR